MKGKRLAALGCAVAWLASAGAAARSFDVQELPADPVALTYRETKEIEKIEKQLQARAEEKAREEAKQVKRARPAPNSVEAIREAFEARAMENAGVDMSARMALYTMPDERRVDAEFATKGDKPLAWSSDHQRLLFLSERLGSAQLFEWNRQSDATIPLTNETDTVLDGCYGPKGELAFAVGEPLVQGAQGASGGVRLRVRVPGGEVRTVTPGPLDTACTWSPTEPLLVYQSRGKSGIDEIVAVNPLAPGAPRYLANGRSPVFTPDGKWVVYSSRTNKGWKIFKVRTDGGGKQSVGAGTMQEVEPSLSRDGKWLLFTGYFEGKPYETDLMIRPFAGGKERKLDIDDKPHRTTW